MGRLNKDSLIVRWLIPLIVCPIVNSVVSGTLHLIDREVPVFSGYQVFIVSVLLVYLIMLFDKVKSTKKILFMSIGISLIYPIVAAYSGM